eukprot:XP_011680014.1 PREDICTED: ankyrin repeat domain-containing protein 29-like [Strongylocentrotus purpuratus]
MSPTISPVKKQIQGADVNRGNNEGCTALHGASQKGHLDVTKCLLSQGVDVNKESNDGATALHSAAYSGHLNITKYLISQGADVNKISNDGVAALHSAVLGGHVDVTKYLISKGTKLAQNDLIDIHLAIQHGRTSIIEKLVFEGADLNVQSSDGQTCLHKAIKLCYKSVNNVQKTATLRKVSHTQ